MELNKKQKRVVKMTKGRRNALIPGVILFVLLILIVESGNGQSLQCVSAKPGLIDTKTGRSRNLSPCLLRDLPLITEIGAMLILRKT